MQKVTWRLKLVAALAILTIVGVFVWNLTEIDFYLGNWWPGNPEGALGEIESKVRYAAATAASVGVLWSTGIAAWLRSAASRFWCLVAWCFLLLTSGLCVLPTLVALVSPTLASVKARIIASIVLPIGSVVCTVYAARSQHLSKALPSLEVLLRHVLQALIVLLIACWGMVSGHPIVSAVLVLLVVGSYVPGVFAKMKPFALPLTMFAGLLAVGALVASPENWQSWTTVWSAVVAMAATSIVIGKRELSHRQSAAIAMACLGLVIVGIVKRFVAVAPDGFEASANSLLLILEYNGLLEVDSGTLLDDSPANGIGVAAMIASVLSGALLILTGPRKSHQDYAIRHLSVSES